MKIGELRAWLAKLDPEAEVFFALVGDADGAAADEGRVHDSVGMVDVRVDLFQDWADEPEDQYDWAKDYEPGKMYVLSLDEREFQLGPKKGEDHE